MANKPIAGGKKSIYIDVNEGDAGQPLTAALCFYGWRQHAGDAGH